MFDLSKIDPSVRKLVTAKLREAGCVFAEDEAALILREAESESDLAALLARRMTGEPLQYVLGWAEFCGLKIKVVPGVFIPRPRSEYLTAHTISFVRESAAPVVLDLCCGSGAIAAAVVTEVSDAEVYAADIDPAAVRCAQANLGNTGEVFEGDLFAALPARLRGRFDVIVANAPYVPTDVIQLMPAEAREYEARVALDGGADGLDVQRRIIEVAGDWLAPGGRLLVETSADQAERSKKLMQASGLRAQQFSSEKREATVVVGAV